MSGQRAALLAIGLAASAITTSTMAARSVVAGATAPRPIAHDAIAPAAIARGAMAPGAIAAGVPEPLQQVGAAPPTTPVTVEGRVLDNAGEPAAGAVVTIANESPARGEFEATTDDDGRFHLVDVALTDVVALGVTWNEFFEPIAPFPIPAASLAAGDFEVAVDAVVVDIHGRVSVSENGADEPAPGAVVEALTGDAELVLGITGNDGSFTLDAIPLLTFADLESGRLRVELPSAWTLAGRFEPGASTTREVDLAAARRSGSIDVGAIRFRRLRNPEAEVELGGRVLGLTVAAAQETTPSDPQETAPVDPQGTAPIEQQTTPIDGLLIQVLRADGTVAAETTTVDGFWSLTLPKGDYSFRLPNAAELGFVEPPPVVWTIEFSRTDLETTLYAAR